jgi:FkbM family methyltransferase
MSVHKDNPKVTLINAAVTEYGGLTIFYDSHGDGISTTETSHKEKWESNPNVKYQKILSPSITLKQVYEIYERKFNFVNIDVEGNNFNILKTYPFYTGLPEVFCVEYDNDASDIINYMSGIGYREIFRNNENLIFKNC